MTVSSGPALPPADSSTAAGGSAGRPPKRKDKRAVRHKKDFNLKHGNGDDYRTERPDKYADEPDFDHVRVIHIKFKRAAFRSVYKDRSLVKKLHLLIHFNIGIYKELI